MTRLCGVGTRAANFVGRSQLAVGWATGIITRRDCEREDSETLAMGRTMACEEGGDTDTVPNGICHWQQERERERSKSTPFLIAVWTFGWGLFCVPDSRPSSRSPGCLSKWSSSRRIGRGTSSNQTYAAAAG